MTETPRSRIVDIVPLTPLQEGLLFVSTLDPDADVYTMQATIDVAGPLDGERLQHAANALLDRHPNLRACFRARKSGEPVALVASHVEIPWRSVDLAGLDRAAQEQRWTAILDADLGNRFDLAKPPLIRFTLGTLGPNQFRLLLTNHHILLDGWSYPLLVRELFTLYTNPDPAALAPVRPYRDFVHWLQGQDQDRARAVWQTALDAVPGPTMLAPAGATRKAARPQLNTLELGPEIEAGLTERARDLGVTVNSIVAAVWGLVLGQSIDSTDILFGATVSGRSPEIEGVESMIGLFLGTAVVRVRTRPQDTLTDVVRRTHETNTTTMDYQHLGLPAIQRVVGQGELFDTLLVFENFPDSRDALDAVTADAGLQITSVQPRGFTHYPLTVTVMLEPTVTINFSYHSTALTENEITTIAARFVALLELVVDQPKTPLVHLDVRTDAERAALARWQHGRRVPDTVRAVTTTVDANAADPAAVAIRCGGTEWTYAQLAVATAQLAGELRTRGVGPEDRVVIALPRGFHYAAAILATLQVGAVYVPIDLGYPRERIAHILIDSAPTLVVGALDTDVASIQPAELLANPVEPIEPYTPDFDPRHPAYLVYTSGSTGRPKGVLGTREALHRRIDWAVAQWSSTKPDIRLAKSSFAFIDGSTELLGALAAGAVVVIATDAELRDIGALARLMLGERITQLTAVPTLATELIAHSPSLREAVSTWILSGEPTNPALVTQLHAGNSDGRIINSYGSSEVAGDVTWHDLAPGDVAIGAPVPGAELEVLDRYLRPVAPGTVGELYVRGPQVARGYHGNPGATATRFVARSGGEQRYATGDLVRWRADGVLEYHGRADQQVKVRGNRVEPGEIDAALATIPGVQACATVATTDATGAVALRAFVVGAGLDPGAVRRNLADRLPAYMVPAVDVIDAIPRLPGGKVDRLALTARPATAVSSRPPRTDLEHTLCRIMAEVLDVPDFGVEDDFFARGGHSLLAARVVMRIQAELKHATSVRMIFDHPTAAAAAATVAREIAHDDAGGDVPLTPIVSRLAQRHGPSSRLNQTVVVRIPPATKLAAVRSIVTALVSRHDALRLRLTRVQEQVWTLRTDSAGTVPIEKLVHDAIAAETAPISDTLAELADAAADRLDPESGIVVQFVRVDQGATASGFLIIVAHRLVVDGASWRILLEDLATAGSSDTSVAAVPVSLRSYAQALTAQAKTAQRLRELVHWREVLAPGAELIAGQHDPGTVGELSHLDIEIGDAVATALLAPAHPIPPADLLLAALRIAITRWRTRTGSTDHALVVDVERHERVGLDGLDLTRTVGWLTNITPVRLPAHEDTETAVLAIAAAMAAAPDSGIGFGMLRYDNPRAARILAALPHPQVLFSYLGTVEFGAAQDWRVAPESRAVSVAANAELAVEYPLEINIRAERVGANTVLRARFTFLPKVIRHSELAVIAELWAQALLETTNLTKADTSG